LQHAKIFLVSMSPSFDNSCCIKFLEKHKYKFRNHLGACMRMRYVPDLHFFIDDSFDRVEKIEKLLKSIRK
jgi:ribosome-binding factor A